MAYPQGVNNNNESKAKIHIFPIEPGFSISIQFFSGMIIYFIQIDVEVYWLCANSWHQRLELFEENVDVFFEIIASCKSFFSRTYFFQGLEGPFAVCQPSVKGCNFLVSQP